MTKCQKFEKRAKIVEKYAKTRDVKLLQEYPIKLEIIQSPIFKP